MKEIQLTHGKVAMVDDEDFESLNQHKWHTADRGMWFYARRTITMESGRRIKVLMHRQIIQTPAGMDTDHIDGNGLNNQRENLRNCTRSQNQWNSRINANNTSGAKGVSWYKSRNVWVSHIGVNGKRKTLGYFADTKTAALAYDNAAREYFGEFAKTNDLRRIP
ncbi:MAG: AP2 domain-containing protein [bacterium]